MPTQDDEVRVRLVAELQALTNDRGVQRPHLRNFLMEETPRLAEAWKIARFKSDEDVREFIFKWLENIAGHFPLPIKVMVRSQTEIASIIKHIPKSWKNPEGLRCNIMFLNYTVDRPDILKLFNPKPDIEELHYVPGALLWSADLRYLTRTNMLKVSSMPIYQDMTIRGLNTARKIHLLMEDAH